MTKKQRTDRFWRYLRGLAPPLVLFGLLLGALVYALHFRLRGEEEYDRLILREWLLEARVFRQTLPELVRTYAEMLRSNSNGEDRTDLRDSIHEHLAALGEVTRAYQSQLPLFPVIHQLRLEIWENPEQSEVIEWQSRLAAAPDALERLRIRLFKDEGRRAELLLGYQLHAYAERQEALARQETRLRTWLSLLAIAAAAIAVLWVMVFLSNERTRELERYRSQRRLDQTERKALEEKLLRQAAEHEREESERRLLEQKIATQEAERQALALKSQLHADIGIMAGTYAHNIKNLLVRPGDLLQRALQIPGQSEEAHRLLKEVQHSLHAVTERTQQILKTVRSDPTQAQLEPCELNQLMAELHETWSEIARQKWKVNLRLLPFHAPLKVRADRSHLQQALENLIFNARDATFERRAQRRDEVRVRSDLDSDRRREALIAAADWYGDVTLEADSKNGQALLRVRDNGSGMPPEVQDKCFETHYTTKRGSALYEGNNTGMGLGLTFVKATIEHHHGKLKLQSSPETGTVFEIELPLFLDSEEK